MDDLWGPPFVLQSDSPRKPIPRGCEFWFDHRTDVLEDNFQNAKYCEIVWKILNEKKKQDDEVLEVEKNSVAIQNDDDDAHEISSSDSDKTVSAILPDADTSSAKSVLDEDENTSSISDAQTVDTSDAQTIKTKDSSNNNTKGPETRVKPQETVAKDPITVEVAEDADTSSSPVLANKIEEAEEHSCSSLVSDQVLDPIKQAPENKSSSAISQESIGGSTLETREKVREEAKATNEAGELRKDHQQNDSLQDIVTVSEPFTTESLLEMCDEPVKGREVSCDERSKRPNPGAVKTVGTEELIINLLRQKAGSNPTLNPKYLLLQKKQNISNSSDNKGMNTTFIRNTKQKVGGEAAVKNPPQAIHQIIRGPNVPTQHADSTVVSKGRISEKDEQMMIDSVVTVSDLQNKTGKELRSIAKAWKITHYYKLKKEDLLQRLTKHLTDCTKESMEP